MRPPAGIESSQRRRILFLRAILALLAVLLAGAPPARAEDTGPPACEAGRSLVSRLRGDDRLAAIEAEAETVPNGRGRLWRIEREGIAPSFLFGTMHVSDPRVLDLPASVEDALGRTATVVIETLDVLDERASTALFLAHPELMTLPGDRSLADGVPEPERPALEASLAAKGMPYASVRTLQPWFIAMGLMMPSCEAARIRNGARPLDIGIALDARAAGRPVAGLESALEQLRAMASMPMDLQFANLKAVLSMEREIPDLFETMIEFYLEGRIAAIAPLSDMVLPPGEMSEALRRDYTRFETRIVTDRNHRMAERLGAHLDKGSAFVAVGALHLPGREGLVELLRAEGWRLTRIE